MFYRTRHMVALKGFTYFDDEIAAGANFYATPVDGGYFVKIGRAADTPEPVVAPLQVYQPAQPVEPVEPPAPEPTQVEEAAEPEQAQEPEVAAPMPTPAPRRGRPPRQRA